MKMKADEKFKGAVVAIINKLKEQQNKNNGSTIVKYPKSILISIGNKNFDGYEDSAIDFLKNEKVIKEIGKSEPIETGKVTDSLYYIQFQILQPLDIYFESYLSNTDIGTRKLIFNVKTGSTAYINVTGKSYQINLKPGTIQYQVVYNTLSALGKKTSYEKCIEGTTDNRSDATPQEKVRDALKEIRRQFRENGIEEAEAQSIFKNRNSVSILIPYTIIP